jgi:hypothetical protein
MSQSYLKASIDGFNGTGKSGTAARLAVGISKERCDREPVIAYSSDDRWRIYRRTIFEPEGVPLEVIAGESLIHVLKALERADQGCCVFIGDDLTVPWKAGLSDFSEADGYLSFERREQLMNQWRPILRGFRLGNFHAIGIGRLGFQWLKEIDDAGRNRPVQGDSKFNAGGGENFGYEADLELEMHREKRRIRELLRLRNSTTYVCDVIKDAAGGILNGAQFTFEGQKGLYQPGDYRAVYEEFAPYLDFMDKISAPEPGHESTRDLLVRGKTPWARDKAERTSLLEEMTGNLDLCFSSQSKEGKQFRWLTLEFLNGFGSWSRMEEECATGQLNRNSLVLRELRRRIANKEIPTTAEQLTVLLSLCYEDVIHPGGAYITLETALFAKSAEQRKGPQPITRALDHTDKDEMIAGD